MSRSISIATAIAATVLALTAPATAQAAFSISDFTVTPASAPAGSHPDSTVSISFGGAQDEKPNDVIQHFPPGIIPNPEALPKCSSAQLTAGTCPANSQIGTVQVTAQPDLLPAPLTVSGNVYNLAVQAPYVGGLGFDIVVVPGVIHSPLEAPFTVRTSVRDITSGLPEGEPDVHQTPLVPMTRDYGLTGLSANLPTDVNGIPVKITNITYTLFGTPPTAAKPYITTSTACLTAYPELQANSHGDSTLDSKLGNLLTSTDCGPVPFDPSVSADPETTRTDTPSGLDLNLHLPDVESPRHESHLQRAEIKLPEGVAISPPAGEGLQACTDAQIGIGSNDPPSCPSASDIGNVKVTSVNLPDPVNGDLYLGEPRPNDTYRLFIAFPIADGAWIKLPGSAVPDPDTGQLTTAFNNVPPLPFTDFELDIKGGNNAVLVNPPKCGPHTLQTALTPWIAAPDYPPALDEHPQDTLVNSYDGAGAACPDPLPFTPAGNLSTDPTQAGANSKLDMSLNAPDREQILKSLKISLPKGLVGGLTGMSLCPGSTAASGACGEQTRVGSVTASVGSGPSPLSLPGSVFLTEPFQGGDPAGLAIVIPAKVGPFDFGNVTTRARVIFRNDGTLDVALIDDLPRIIQGIPIRIRDVHARVDRDGFMRNPTSCGQLGSAASFFSRDGAQHDSSAPYQATGCEKLPFDPTLRFVANGEAKRFGHPSLQAIVAQRPGEANIARSHVLLPDILRPDTVVLNKPGVLCQGGQALTRSCPPTSLVGTAKATTPLLPQPLRGPIYIVQNPGNVLPALAIYLDGAVSIRLDAQNSISGVRTVNDFGAVPDVPLSSFELSINGGANGILKNFNDLCATKSGPGDASFTAHSGKTSASRPPLETPVCAASAKAKPRVSVSLRGVASGRPTMKLKLRKAAKGAKLRKLTVNLPRTLRGVAKRKAKGGKVLTSRKLKAKQWKLSGRRITLKLPKSGVNNVTITLRKGALRSTGSLARKVKRHRTKVAFKLRAGDVNGNNFRLTGKARARR